MTRPACLCLVLLSLLPGARSDALVNPRDADIEEQGWMANILIKGSLSTFYELFCKGALIHEYWVISSPACFLDPYAVIENVVGSDRAEYAVALGNLGGLYKVEERIISPDGNVMLLRLNRPAKNKPLKLLWRSPAQLRGVQVSIFNSETTASLADAFFNPDGDLPVSCKVGGNTFFADKRMCYVVARPKFRFRQLMARGRVVDPLGADAPKSPLNASIVPDTSGSRLHVDFSEFNSFPCHEDLGAPIIATLNGELVQVGLVVAAGMTTGVPLCNGSFYNVLLTLDGQQEFIDTSIARGRFAQQCPGRAELRVEKLNATQVRLSWDAIHGAVGYQALYTRALGHEPIQVADLGNALEATVELPGSDSYTIALQAYNSACTGAMSRPQLVRAGQ